MAHEILAVLRSMLEAFDRRDRATWLRFRHPESEVVPATIWVDVGLVKGPEASWEHYVETMAAFEELRFAEHFAAEPVGPDQLIVRHHRSTRGRASGAGVEVDLWVLVTFHQGRVLREEWFGSEEEARRATGVSDAHR